MSVFKKDKAWYVRYRDEDGLQRQKKAGHTKAEAVKLEKTLLKLRQEAKDSRREQEQIRLTEANQKRQDITFYELEKLYKNYLIQTGRNKSTNIYVAARIAKVLGNEYLKDITEKKIMGYQSERIKNGISNSTLNTECSILHAMLSFAIRLEYLTSVPRIEKLKTPPNRCRYLSKKEAEALITASGNDYNMQCLIRLALYTGMRKSEMTALKWKDVDLEAGFIRIERSKNGQRRDTPLSDEALGMLKEMKNSAAAEGKSNDYDSLFVRLAPSSFFIKFGAILKKAGISDFKFHDLRHTCASWLAIKGVPLYTIKEILGHSCIEMTMRYAHLSAESKKEAVNKINLPIFNDKC